MSKQPAPLFQLLEALGVLSLAATRQLRGEARADLEEAMGEVAAACAHVREQLGLDADNVAAHADRTLAKLRQQAEPPAPTALKQRREGKANFSSPRRGQSQGVTP